MTARKIWLVHRPPPRRPNALVWTWRHRNEGMGRDWGGIGATTGFAHAGVVVAGCWLAPAPAAAENRIALVIGNSSYETVSVLPNPTPEAFEAYLVVYATPPYAPRVRSLLDWQREMIAWYRAVTLNTAASFQAFLAAYTTSDLGVTARRLMERAGNRLLASLAPVAATCPCGAPAPPAREPREKKAKSAPKEKQAKKRGRRDRDFVSDEEVGRGAPPRPVGVATPSGPPVSIGIGIPIGRGGGGHPGGPVRSGPTSSGPRPMGGHRF